MCILFRINLGDVEMSRVKNLILLAFTDRFWPLLRQPYFNSRLTLLPKSRKLNLLQLTIQFSMKCRFFYSASCLHCFTSFFTVNSVLLPSATCLLLQQFGDPARQDWLSNSANVASSWPQAGLGLTLHAHHPTHHSTYSPTYMFSYQLSYLPTRHLTYSAINSAIYLLATLHAHHPTHHPPCSPPYSTPYMLAYLHVQLPT